MVTLRGVYRVTMRSATNRYRLPQMAANKVGVGCTPKNQDVTNKQANFGVR
jgi:hypothetical protein